ncbi:hypothetical protein CFOL_v3_22071 [Cephalotus follicularis]|uniref:Uncharacterized protein n=1 Tax=Cephalotus follicularis TaxID=3775 RepID=A0A1Q3CED9_CEPFO|nr:hypothetical protein CFOL_v3_22071 [Cephalotus follicularis]
MMRSSCPVGSRRMHSKAKRRQRNRNLKAKIKQIKKEMAQIAAEQKSIEPIKEERAQIAAEQKSVREGQMELRKKFKEYECAKLKKGSIFVSKQSARTQCRLHNTKTSFKPTNLLRP